MKSTDAVKAIERDVMFSYEKMQLIKRAAYLSRMNVNYFIAQSVLEAAKNKIKVADYNAQFLVRQLAAEKRE